MLKILSLLLIVAAFVAGCKNIRSSAFDEANYLGDEKNSPEIYDPAAPKGLFVPIDLETDNFGVGFVDKFIAVDFANSAKYSRIELWEFDGNGAKKAVALLVNSEDSSTSVYAKPRTEIDPKLFGSALNEPEIVVRDFQYDFNITDDGVDFFLYLRTSQGERVELRVIEKISDPDQLNTLGNFGFSAKDPNYFPLFYLRNFSVVTEDFGEIRATAGGREMKPAFFLERIEGKVSYSAIYCEKPAIGFLNTDFEGEIPRIFTNDPALEYAREKIEFLENGGRYEIKKIASETPGGEIEILFSPALPDIAAMKSGEEVSGRWSAAIDTIRGVAGGTYSIIKKENNAGFTMDPSMAAQSFLNDKSVMRFFWKAFLTFEDDKAEIKSDWYLKKIEYRERR